ncbi:hypothetical protein BDZ91DRAFT_803312 [Kalaharituber pfeilii]|nr:hypothetical protein BDZ91DRAFT_803312 [Kalaharituber pfeilii]
MPSDLPAEDPRVVSEPGDTKWAKAKAQGAGGAGREKRQQNTTGKNAESGGRSGLGEWRRRMNEGEGGRKRPLGPVDETASGGVQKAGSAGAINAGYSNVSGPDRPAACATAGEEKVGLESSTVPMQVTSEKDGNEESEKHDKDVGECVES